MAAVLLSELFTHIVETADYVRTFDFEVGVVAAEQHCTFVLHILNRRRSHIGSDFFD